ncbi:hypothetical protein [Paracidovorax avenae]|uniref:hypothetical protein n=1 Tax=Paracidovorax avenae TaxID=80867 RepID=UPI001AD841FC|nr:hypothetical protein [Paracidovorax avenae]
MVRLTDNLTLLTKVPTDGSSIGNQRLRSRLKWDYEKYFRIRNRLVESGELVVGNGRGGSVYLPEDSPYLEKKKNSAARSADPESATYLPVSEGLKNFWIPEIFPSFTEFEVKITAHQGSKNTGGVWTRPDIAVYGYGAYRFFPGRTYDLISFEVKLSTTADIRAIFEAKGHSRRASRSFVICVGALDLNEQNAISQIAREQKIGFIVAADAEDPETWEVLVDAIRSEPDPMWVDEFVRLNFDEKQQQRIEAWCR